MRLLQTDPEVCSDLNHNFPARPGKLWLRAGQRCCFTKTYKLWTILHHYESVRVQDVQHNLREITGLSPSLCSRKYCWTELKITLSLWLNPLVRWYDCHDSLLSTIRFHIRWISKTNLKPRFFYGCVFFSSISIVFCFLLTNNSTSLWLIIQITWWRKYCCNEMFLTGYLKYCLIMLPDAVFCMSAMSRQRRPCFQWASELTIGWNYSIRSYCCIQGQLMSAVKMIVDTVYSRCFKTSTSTEINAAAQWVVSK